LRKISENEGVNHKERASKIKKYLPVIVYTVISLIILLPLLKPGYILTLDMIFAPRYKIIFSTDTTKNILLLSWILKLFSLIIPTWIIQKLLLSAVLFLSGLSMHRLVPVKSTAARYFAGILYMINPFTYTRFLAGHLNLLLAYSITPFAIKTFFDLLDEPNPKRAIMVGLWLAIISSLNIHNLFILLLFAVCLISYSINQKNTFDYLKNVLGYVFLSAITFILLSLYWIIPFFYSKSPISSFDIRHIQAFITRSDPTFGVIFNVASMYGFWVQYFLLPKDHLSFWYMFFYLILILAILGILFSINDRKIRAQSIAVAVTGFISIILAVGVAHPITKPIFIFLYNNCPFFNGYREPQKFVALLTLAYSFLGAIGLDGILINIQKSKFQDNKTLNLYSKNSLALLACFLPLIYTYPIFWGFSGQLNSIDYPRSWYKTNNFLNTEIRKNQKVLFLPWHMYMIFDFAQNPGPIYNPAQLFFDKEVIQGDNMEVYGVYSSSTNPISKRIEKILIKNRKSGDLGDKLSSLDIGYIILSKNADYKNYKFLYQQRDLKIIYDKPEIVIFKNIY